MIVSNNRVARWRIWLAVLVFVCLVLFFYHRDNRNYACEGCLSRQSRNQLRIGIWMGPSIPISPDRVEERTSNLYRDYLASNHTHVWDFAQGSPYGLLGWGGCALGHAGRSMGDLAALYEQDSRFRGFVHRKEAKGELISSDFAAACLLPDCPKNQEYVSDEFKRLARIADALKDEYSRQ